MTKGKRKQSPFIRISRSEWARVVSISKDNSARPLPSPANQKPKAK